MRNMCFVIHYKIIFSHRLPTPPPPRTPTIALLENKVDVRERLPAFMTVDFEENVKLFHSIMVDEYNGRGFHLIPIPLCLCHFCTSS